MKFLNALFSLLILASCQSGAQNTNLAVAEFEKGIAQSNIQLLDVRTPGEFQSGHLKNALLADWNNNAEFERRAASLDKNKPVYLYCLAGGRSSAAAAYLKEKGYTTYNLQGGISAWKKEGKPVEQDVAVKQITLAEYQSQIPADKTVLVDFSAVWCPPCKKMDPVLDTLQKQQAGKFVMVKINGGEQTDICKQLNIENFPTFIIYKAAKEVWRKEGVVDIGEFIKILQ